LTAAVVHVVRGIGLTRLVDFAVYQASAGAATSSRAKASQVTGPQCVERRSGAVRYRVVAHMAVLAVVRLEQLQ
jgi:hypothetical protein